MGQNDRMDGPSDVSGVLRDLGLRSTPQRRAILRAFGGTAEHLSADEVHARASRELPDLGRGTVYAALAEFTELGLLAAFGTSEPVRYETNTTPHDHFRCRLCLRLFDVEPLNASEQSMPRGFTLERIETRAEGVCADCAGYQRGLRKGALTIAASGALAEPLPSGVASLETDGPLGTVLLAASPLGLIRLAFDDHGDADELRDLARSRRGSHAARGHLQRASGELASYLRGEASEIRCPLDWAGLATTDRTALAATRVIPYGDHRSYAALGTALPAYEVGLSLGANPIAIAAPCHRVTRGVESPEIFVGGAERRRWLDAHERQHAG
jgi:Fe2+ or Zn2+ uptake regulation protein/O6-methylguanine-DNA--protein-cysteine methyltransferase